MGGPATRILNLEAHDLRFPTSAFPDGSDAMNPDPDYSAAYVILTTDHPKGLGGHGITFTVGRGNHEVGQLVGPLFQIFQIEHAFRQPAKETRHAVL